MLYLLLSIVLLSLLFVIFKLFDKYKINSLHAIVVNYLVAAICGFICSETKLPMVEIPSQPWFVGAVCLGFLFISIFQVMALTAQKNGLSVAAVAGKMSVIIPVIFGIIVYKESAGWVKLIGIVLALIAVYLSATKQNETPTSTNNLLYPIILFLGSGVIDTSLKYIETHYVEEHHIALFSSSIFSLAFVIGIIVVLIQGIRKGFVFRRKDLIAGIILGIPNYFSIVALIRALSVEHLESSVVFTLNNVGGVLLTTLIAVVFFKEKLSKINWAGIVLAIFAILLVSLF